MLIVKSFKSDLYAMTVGPMESVGRHYLCEVMVQIAWRSIDRWRRREYVGGGWSSAGSGCGNL